MADLEKSLDVPVLTSNASLVFAIYEHLKGTELIELDNSLFKKLAA